VAHKTTVNLRDDLHLKLRTLAQREGVSVGEMLNRLLADALAAREQCRFRSFGAGEGDPDLGLNAEKYLREGLG